MPARIIVADTGGGIPADRLPLIFDRFTTGDDVRQRGTGLGLPLVRAVARAHGGNVTVSSEFGQGSAFELTLPAQLGAGLALAGRRAAGVIVDQELDMILTPSSKGVRGDERTERGRGGRPPDRAEQADSGSIAVFAVAAIVVSLVTSSATAPPPAPAAAGFSLTALGPPGSTSR